MAIDGIIDSPSFIKIRTASGTQQFINPNMIVAVKPVERDENMADIVMLNGENYMVNETPSRLMENNYSRDVRNGSSIINFLG